MTLGKSLAENWIGMVLMACSALMVAIGQLLWKFSKGQDIILLGFGFVLYGIGAILMITAFKHGKLSVVHPVQSLSYVLGAVIGYFFLHEILGARQCVGILLIISGVVFIGAGDHE